jgi:hypothetical protein
LLVPKLSELPKTLVEPVIKNYQWLQPDEQLPILLVLPQQDPLLETDPLILLQDLLVHLVHQTLIQTIMMMEMTMEMAMVIVMVTIMMMTTMIYEAI